MINLYKIFRTQLVLAVVLCATNLGFGQSPVIRVPATCNVVVAGTGVGAVTGPGGQVGNGGVVCMPDPYPADTFTYIPNGTTVTGWSLLGDLSIGTSSIPPAAGIYGSVAVTSLKIQSYNKNLRVPSENGALYPQSNPIWGRSKGRVTVSYAASPCGGSISFEVYKTYTNTIAPGWVPPIIGPDCVAPLTQYTYSVDQIASDNATDNFGFDSYYWTGLPALATNSYFSADKSSITFTTPSPVTPFTLICSYGRCNAWDGDAVGAPLVHATYVKKPVGTVPLAPTLSNALNLSPIANCLPTGTVSYTTTITPLAGYTYVWTCTNATWALAQTGTQNSILTITNFDNNPGTLSLTVTNGSCAPVIFNYIINRTFAPALGVTSVGGGTPVTCISTATSYSLPQNALGNLTNWTISPVVAGGPTVANGLGSGSTCTVTPGTTAGQYSLIATAKAATTCTTTSTNITINVKPSTPVITSPTCIVRGTTAISSISCTIPSGMTGTTGYTWSLPTGWSCTNCTTNNPTFTPNATTGASEVLTVTATVNGCVSNTGSSSTIYYSTVAPASITNTCWNVNVPATTPTNTTVTVGNVQNFGTYSIPTSLTGLYTSYTVSGGTFTLNTVNTVAGNYTLPVTHTNGSCTSTTNYLVSVVASTATVSNFAPNGFGCDVYNVTLPTGTTFTGATGWFVNGVLASGANVGIVANTLTLCGSTAPTSVCADVYINGCRTRVCASLTGTHGAKQASLSGSSKLIEGVTIYPNPTTGNFSIRVETFKEVAVAVLTDITGKQIATYNLVKGENKIQNEGLAKGTYLVVLKIDGKQEARKIIIK